MTNSLCSVTVIHIGNMYTEFYNIQHYSQVTQKFTFTFDKGQAASIIFARMSIFSIFILMQNFAKCYNDKAV